MPVGKGGLPSVIKVLDLCSRFILDPFPLKERDFSLSLVLIHEVKSPVFIIDQDWDSRN